MRKLLIALVFAVMSVAGAAPVAAEPIDVKVMTGLICNTAEQVASFVTKLPGAPDQSAVAATIEAVNAEAGDPHACVIASALVTKIEPQATVAGATGAVDEIVALTVAGVRHKDGAWHLFTPQTYFSARETAQRSI